MKLRTMAVIALALVAGGAQAQDAGWDTKMGAVFGIGIDGDPMGSYDGKVGLQYNLGPQAALRLGIDLSREACGDIDYKAGNYESTTVCDLNPDPLSDPTDPSNGFAYNSAFGLKLSAEYLMRTSSAAVAPYFGGGVYVDFQTASLKGENSDNQPLSDVTEFNNKGSQLGFGLLGKAGVEWRINKVIALFAEYQLDISLYEKTKTTYDVKTTSGGVGSVDADFETSSSNIFNMSTGVSNGGLVGIVAFF